MDFRVEYLQEARECIRCNSEHKIASLPWWANAVGAIANAVIASVPDSVAEALVAQEAHERAAREHVKEQLRR